MIISGTLLGLDNYEKIKIDTINKEEVLKNIQDIINPYYSNGNTLICVIIIPKRHKEYYIELVQNNIGKTVNIEVLPKRYSFNGKRGTSIVLKNINIISE